MDMPKKMTPFPRKVVQVMKRMYGVAHDYADPCRRCGQNDRQRFKRGKYAHIRIKCENCGAHANWQQTRAEAYVIWNIFCGDRGV